MMKSLKKHIARALVALMAVSIPMAAMPAPKAEASLLGSVISAVATGIQVNQVKSAMEYYNNDEQGRQELFEAMKEQQGVNDDPELNARLASLMESLSTSVAAVDPSINDKPYNYFVNADTTFNAACSLGHNMTVNTVLFDLIDNDSEIAVVLGHEMAHGQKDHVIKGFEKSIPTTIIAGAIAGSGSTAGAAAANVIANYTSAVNITKPQEWEADNIAFDYICASDYNIGACAAIWQRVIEKKGASGSKNFVGEIFSPSDHPTHEERRDNYARKLSEYSHGHVTAANGTVKVYGHDFVTPAAYGSMSSNERAYFVAGNLARAFHNNEAPDEAYLYNGTLYIDNQAIITPVEGDESASSLCDELNALLSLRRTENVA